MSKCVRRAVSDHIDAELERNPGVRERYEEAMSVLVNKAGGNVSSLVAKRRRKAS